MNRVEVSIIGLLSATRKGDGDQKTINILVLKEDSGTRCLLIRLSPFEIGTMVQGPTEIEKPQPLTHDLLKNIILGLSEKVTEATITDVDQNGAFYAVIALKSGEFPARPSDAIALARRFGAPIFVAEEVIRKAGHKFSSGGFEKMNEEDKTWRLKLLTSLDIASRPETPLTPDQPPQQLTEMEKLKLELEKAVQEENYERAAEIRDRIRELENE